MRTLLFACKRLLKRPSFVLLLVLYGAAVFFASLDASVGSLPTAGVFSPDNSETASRIVAYLEKNGFALCSDEEEMLSRLERGELNCCVILPSDLTERLEQGNLGGCVRFVETPSSFAPELYRSHVTAALFREAAPYLSAEGFAESGVERGEVLAAYASMLDGGYVFSFELVTVTGAPPDPSRALLMGAVSILLFALVLMGGEWDEIMVRRLGLGNMLRYVTLPGAVVRLVFCLAAGGAGLWLAGAVDLMLPLAAYGVTLTALSLFLAAILPDRRYLHILLLIGLLASLALCPVFTDLALVSPVVGVARRFLPPYWFYLAAEVPLAWFAAGVCGLVLACGALCLRYGMGEKLKIVGH